MKGNLIRKTAEALCRSKRAVAFTGAGISVESGIPDFRGPTGLWKKYDPMEYATIDAFLENPGKVWNMLKEMGDLLDRAKPNPAHRALAKLEEMNLLRSVITQNIDNLHQAAGNKRVIEFHGTNQTLTCMLCGRQYSRQEINPGKIPPRCRCQGVLKPDIVFFGEGIPMDAQFAANDEARTCDFMLVIGTSAIVSPARELPLMAQRAGATVVEINIEETQLTHYISHWILKGQAGPILQSVLQEIISLRKG